MGSRALWDEAVTGYQWWSDAGRPRRDRWGVTVTAAGQYVWLDQPDTVIALSRYDGPIGENVRCEWGRRDADADDGRA